MKKLGTACFLLCAIGTWAQKPAATGYQIKVTLKPFKNQYIYLGHYYGKQLPIIDSVKLDANSTAVFKGSKKLGGGIYLVGFPDRSNRFEFLVGKEQQFSIAADTADLSRISFTGSSENSSFKAYQDAMTKNGRALEELNKKRRGSAPADSIKYSAAGEPMIFAIRLYALSVIIFFPLSVSQG